jgi:uncharacterized 2Fe-2S/4Fe-4S cluster protein (DUF4445 family)
VKHFISLVTVVVAMAAIVAASAATGPAKEGCPWQCAIVLLNEAIQRVPG